MEYVVYKLHFPAGVHFGAGALSDGVNTPAGGHAVFRAVQEAMAAQGPEGIEALVQAVRSSGLRLSDLFPFIGGELYLPKPLYPVKREENGDSIVKKSFKKLKYIPASQIGVYLQGDLNPLEQVDKLKQLGAFGNAHYGGRPLCGKDRHWRRTAVQRRRIPFYGGKRAVFPGGFCGQRPAGDGGKPAACAFFYRHRWEEKRRTGALYSIAA